MGQAAMLIRWDDMTDSSVFDVAIAGAGPAGITLALELAKRGARCLLVEAGGFEPSDAAGLDPYRGQSAPRPYPLETSRLRYFGGTSGHWGGWCRPLDEIDFEAVDGVRRTGWPVARSDVYKYISDAYRWLEIGRPEFDGPAVSQELQKVSIELPEKSGFYPLTFRFSPPTRFGEVYREHIRRSIEVSCLLNTDLIKVERGQNGRSTWLLQHRDGRRRRLSARFHVLAMGGIENARTLLWSNQSIENPFAMEGDWIGRCFADHFGITLGQLLASPDLNYNRRETAAGGIMARHAPTPEVLRASLAPSHMIALHPVTEDSFLQHDYGLNAVFFGPNPSRLKLFSVRVVAGQTPNRESRLSLVDDVDANGVPRVRLDWRVESEDFDLLMQSAERFGQHVAAAGLGRFRKTVHRAPAIDESLAAGMHHMGTTRMADRSGQGVVDGDCRVFGSDDLYVLGSSVFPAYGYANPTLTIVALSVRAAEHIAGRLRTVS